ncbi:MAG: GNAT family N-acetyltransferase [Planctomycetales bacterium]|nr:GNAT family N-acetyltransferase [Planctomycetales bacterium]
MKVELLTGPGAEIVPLLKCWACDPFGYMKEQGRCDLPGYYLEDIRTLRDRGGFLIAAAEKGNVCGFAVLSKLPWDSEYFDKQMGAVNYLVVDPKKENKDETADQLLQYAENLSRRNGLEFLLSKTSTHDYTAIHSLERNGFFMMDTILSIYYDFRRFPETGEHIKCPRFEVRLADSADCDALVAVSRSAFAEHIGRYHNDKNIPREKATGVYEQWLRSSCSGWADWIVVAEKENQIAGYSVWKKPSDNQKRHGIDLVDYSIVAIDPRFQKQGLFGLLTLEGMKLIREKYRYSEGRTVVDNYGVQRGFIKLGWKICGGRHAFHKWL